MYICRVSTRTETSFEILRFSLKRIFWNRIGTLQTIKLPNRADSLGSRWTEHGKDWHFEKTSSNGIKKFGHIYKTYPDIQFYMKLDLD